MFLVEGKPLTDYSEANSGTIKMRDFASCDGEHWEARPSVARRTSVASSSVSHTLLLDVCSKCRMGTLGRPRECRADFG